MQQLLDRIIDKKELRGISKEFAQTFVDKYLEQHPNVLAEYEQDPERFTKKKSFDKMRSEVRAQLRDVYGVFFKPGYAAKKKKAVNALIESPTQDMAKVVLGLHRSTDERLPYYNFLFQQLFTITGKPESILDLGCGFNPFSYPFLNQTVDYHCADIACDDLQLIEEFFTSLKITHTTHCIDLTNVEAVKQLPRADIGFAFKLFDSLETLDRNVTERLLHVIPCDLLVVSFPTVSIGGKNSINPRQWFEKLVTDKVVGRVTLPNEQFVIITLKK